MWGDIAIAFLLAFITAFVITPYTIRLAKKVGAVDIPNDRRVNKKPMPRLGGLAVIAGFLVSVSVSSSVAILAGIIQIAVPLFVVIEYPSLQVKFAEVPEFIFPYADAKQG